MGTTYTAILLDEFNWSYVGTSQGQRVEEINRYLAERGRGGEVIAVFHHGIVVDLEKDWPESENVKKFLLGCADKVIYFPNHEVGSLKQLGQ